MTRPTVQDALDRAVRSVARFPDRRPAAMPLKPVSLAFSLVAVALAALAFAVLTALTALLVLYVGLGRDGFTDFMTDLRFDPRLQARIGAWQISAAYVGVALTTMAAARLRGGRGAWPALLAAGPGRWRVRDAVPIALLTLGYAAAFTLVQVAGRERHLLTLGPTDLLLLGTLAANLVILAPLAEELVFRGWLYTALRARWRFLPSFLLTTAAFAAIHWDRDHRHMLRVLPLALAVGLLRELTGSIRPTIALHAAYNLVIVVITLAAT